MDLLVHLRQTIHYNAWANEQVAGSLQVSVNPPPKAVLVLAHIVGAERLWHARLLGAAAPEVWPGLGVAQCAAGVRELKQTWNAWANALVAADLDRVVHYVNSKGEPWSNSVCDILTHMTHHSAYHRGQIATLLGAAGHSPAYSDYIHAVRQGFLQRSEAR